MKRKKLGTQITTAQNAGGTYSEDVDLEAYAGKRVVIYLKAKAAADSAYLDSVAGITNELEIPTVAKTEGYMADKLDTSRGQLYCSRCIYKWRNDRYSYTE